jgi:PAS domain S-box-containing protein
MVPWLDTRSSIGGVVFFSERITELKKAREKIANQERLLADVIDGASAIISAFDYEGRIMLANAEAARVLQTTKEGLVGTFVGDHLPQDRALQFTARHNEVMASGQSQVVETTLLIHGTERTVLAARHPLRDAAGITYGTASVMTEITKQKQIEADLSRREGQTRDALAALE